MSEAEVNGVSRSRAFFLSFISDYQVLPRPENERQLSKPTVVR